MSAKYKALGAGLMSFGQGLQQQMAETARQRREESLLALKRQWQLEDRADEREFQVGLLDRQEETAERNRQRTFDDQIAAAQINRGFANMDADRDWERGADDRERAARMDEGRIGLLEAQTGLASAQAERGTTGVDPSRWREMTLHEQRMIEQGKSPEEAYQEAMKLVYPERSNFEQQQLLRERINTSREIHKSLRDEFEREDMYRAYGIPEDTPVNEAAQMIFEAQWPIVERSAFGEQEQPQEPTTQEDQPVSHGTLNNPIDVSTLTGPEDLVTGNYYLVNGVRQRWNGQRFE